MLKPSNVLSIETLFTNRGDFQKNAPNPLLLFGFSCELPSAVWRRIQTLYFTEVLDMMAGLTQKELGNFLQGEIFDPYLLASCGVNLDRGGGQLGSNMSSSTATGKFEIV